MVCGEAACSDAQRKVEGRAALGASLSNAMLGGKHWLIMLHRWKGLIEMMQEFFPILILLRLTKTNGVILQPLPLHQQEILVL